VVQHPLEFVSFEKTGTFPGSNEASTYLEAGGLSTSEPLAPRPPQSFFHHFLINDIGDMAFTSIFSRNGGVAVSEVDARLSERLAGRLGIVA
jgi:hypothetical protein